jgi:hypothetical protein
MNKQVEYERLLNEHRIISNQISDIKAEHFELNEEQNKQIQNLQRKQVVLMNQMQKLFGNNY